VSFEWIVAWKSGRFELHMWDTGLRLRNGLWCIAYTFHDHDKMIFASEHFADSRLHADDSDQTIVDVLTILSHRPEYTDPEHFEYYTPEQIEWAQQNGEELSLLVYELEERVRRGRVACTVEICLSAWLVTFDRGGTLLLQSDYDRAAFAVGCGAIQAPYDWDGLPSKLGEDWACFDPSTIHRCPADYLGMAEPGEES